MQFIRVLLAAALCAGVLSAEPADVKQRIRAIRDLGKLGSESIPKITPYLSDESVDVRVEAVEALTDIGGIGSLDPLLAATRDNDPEVQIRAAEGLVNFYYPGYVKSSGISGSLKRVGSAIRAKFGDPSFVIIEPYITVRPEVITELGKLARGGASMESRAAAARAVGVLRGKAAVDDLVTALRSKDDQVMYESLIALQKIRDTSAGPRVIFLMRDLNDKVQIAAIETAGLLRAKEATPTLRDLLKVAKKDKVRRAALTALAMLPDPSNHAIFIQYLSDRDEGLRAAAAEGLARLKDPADLSVIQSAFNSERKMSPRLSMAFAAVALGQNAATELSPLRYLVNTLNSNAYRGVAQPFLVELSRDPGVRRTLFTLVNQGTRDEKIHLGQVLATTGDKDALPYLEALAKDPDLDVASEGLKSLKVLRARL